MSQTPGKVFGMPGKVSGTSVKASGTSVKVSGTPMHYIYLMLVMQVKKNLYCESFSNLAVMGYFSFFVFNFTDTNSNKRLKKKVFF